jgi:hypothetical protein
MKILTSEYRMMDLDAPNMLQSLLVQDPDIPDVLKSAISELINAILKNSTVASDARKLRIPQNTTIVAAPLTLVPVSVSPSRHTEQYSLKGRAGTAESFQRGHKYPVDVKFNTTTASAANIPIPSSSAAFLQSSLPKGSSNIHPFNENLFPFIPNGIHTYEHVYLSQIDEESISDFW